jgi:methanogenic corrinoid protein MtbC1
MDSSLLTLQPDGLQQFKALQADAVTAVTERFYRTHGSIYERFGARGREACREDIAFHLEFLRPVLEFGFVQPMTDYLVWLSSVLASRSVPTDHLPISLDWLSEFFADHMNAADAAVISAALRKARAELVAGAGAPHRKPPSPAAWREAAPFEAALLAGKRRDALRVVDGCLDDGRGLVDIELHVIVPALYQIGEKWQLNKVTVAEEHMATAIAQVVMTSALQRSMPAPANGKRALLACVAGNHHALGLQMLSDAFQLAGWDVDYLGADVPTGAVVKHATQRVVDLIGLSVSFAQQLPVVKDVVTRLTLALGEGRPAIMVGGLAINRFHQLASVVGADAYCRDAQTAVAYGAGR